MGRTFPWAFTAGLVALAVNLRAPFVGVAPLADRAERDLGVAAGAVGLLTSLPVLCFALAAPLAVVVSRRTGPEVAGSLCLSAVVAGVVVRSAGGYGLAVVGSLLLGVAITVGNVVSPVLIRRWVDAERVGLVTGIWVSALNVGSMAATVAADPLARTLGWRGALLAGGAAAAVGLVAWEAWRRSSPGGRVPSPAGSAPAPEHPAGPAAPGPTRQPRAWLLALAFAAQAASYYGVTAWLPSILSARVGIAPAAAGAVASVFQVGAIAGALGAPLLARRRSSVAAVAAVGVLWLALPLILLVTPEAYAVGVVLGGVAQGGGLAIVFTLVAQAQTGDAAGTRLSAFVQGVGYAIAACWPPLLGLAHDATGSWAAPLLLTLLSTSAFLALGVLAARRVDR